MVCIGPIGHQKRTLFLVVAGGCQDLPLPCVQESVPVLFGKPIRVTISFVSNRHCISLWLGSHHFRMYHSVMPYVYVDSSCRGLSEVLLRLCLGDRSSMRQRHGAR